MKLKEILIVILMKMEIYLDLLMKKGILKKKEISMKMEKLKGILKKISMKMEKLKVILKKMEIMIKKQMKIQMKMEK